MITNRPAPELHLGVAGFEYPDLFTPERLKDLSDVFDQELSKQNPELFSRWVAYRRDPGDLRSPVEVSALLIGVSGYVSRFIIRLFGVESEAATLAALTADQDPVFRFKVDFVRRRVLPMLNKLAVAKDATSVLDLEKKIERLRDAASDGASPNADLELETARAASKLLDADRAFGEKVCTKQLCRRER